MSKSFCKPRAGSPDRCQFTRLEADDELQEIKNLHQKLTEKASHETPDFDVPLFESQQAEVCKILSGIDSGECQTVFDLLKFCGVTTEPVAGEAHFVIATMPPPVQHVLHQYAKTQKRPGSPRREPLTVPPIAKIRSFVKTETYLTKSVNKFVLKSVSSRSKKAQPQPIAKRITKIENIGLSLQKSGSSPFLFIKATATHEPTRCASCTNWIPAEWDPISVNEANFCSYNCMILLLAEDRTLGEPKKLPRKNLKAAPSFAVLKQYGGCLEDEGFYHCLSNDYEMCIYNLG